MLSLIFSSLIRNMLSYNIRYFIFGILFVFGGIFNPFKTYSQEIIASEFSVTMISDSADHNAFTDLIMYKRNFYCVFRESDAHVPGQKGILGNIKVIKSKKGLEWETMAILSSDKYDLRDPKLSILPDGRLMILMGGSEFDKGQLKAQLSHVSFSSDGVIFTDPQPVSIDSTIRSKYDWVWSITWKDTVGYAALYQINLPGGKWNVALMKTYDGISYEPLLNWNVGPRPCEARIRFAPDERMIVIVRRESGGNGILGISPPPYTEWTWHDLSMKLGGPNFLVISNEEILIGSRIFTQREVGQRIGYISEKDRTGIFLANDIGEIRKVIELPSGGDTSYPGMLIYKNYLYVTYYSSHDGKAKIYFAKARLIDVETLR